MIKETQEFWPAGWDAVVDAKEAAKLRKLEELKIGRDDDAPFGGVAPEYVTLHPGRSDEVRIPVPKLADDGELMKTWLVERLRFVTRLIDETGAVEAVVEFLGQGQEGGDTDDTRH